MAGSPAHGSITRHVWLTFAVCLPSSAGRPSSMCDSAVPEVDNSSLLLWSRAAAESDGFVSVVGLRRSDRLDVDDDEVAVFALRDVDVLLVFEEDVREVRDEGQAALETVLLSERGDDSCEE